MALNFAREIEDICSFYLEEIRPSFALVEKLAGEDGIPIQFYTEIRATVTHLARVSQLSRRHDNTLPIAERESITNEISSNLQKAERHLKRFQLDCQKWCCAYYEEKNAAKLEELSRDCTLRLVDNGGYLDKARRLELDARNKHNQAKLEDSEGTELVMPKYIEAVKAYSDLYDHLHYPTDDEAQMIERLTERRKANRSTTWLWVIIGGAATLVGLILNLL